MKKLPNKRSAFASLLLVAPFGAAQGAAVITNHVLDAEGRFGDTLTNSVLVTSITPTADGASVVNLTHTIAGADYDGDGTNDTIAIDYTLTAAAGVLNFDGGSRFGVDAGGGTDDLIGNGEGANVALSAVNVSLSDATALLTLNTSGITGFSTVGFAAGENFELDGVATGHNGGADYELAATASFFDILGIANDDGTDGNFRLRTVRSNLDFTVEVPMDMGPVDPAIPEPSRAVLLGLGALAMFLRRRK